MTRAKLTPRFRLVIWRVRSFARFEIFSALSFSFFAYVFLSVSAVSCIDATSCTIDIRGL